MIHAHAPARPCVMLSIDELRPEIRGAVVLAVRYVNKAVRESKRRRKWQEKAQKHIARAERYSKGGA